MCSDNFNYIRIGNVVYYCGEHCYAKILKIEKPSTVYIQFRNQTGDMVEEKTMMSLIFRDKDAWDEYERLIC